MTARVRLVAWAAVLAGAFSLLAVASFTGGGVETDAERIQRLQESFACPECRGESVADSNAAVAATIRQFIATEVAAGSSDTEIRNALLRAYEARVLLNPPGEGLATLLWVLPVVAAVGGAVVVTSLATRALPDDGLSDADRALVSAARSSQTGSDVDGGDLDVSGGLDHQTGAGDGGAG